MQPSLIVQRHRVSQRPVAIENNAAEATGNQIELVDGKCSGRTGHGAPRCSRRSLASKRWSWFKLFFCLGGRQSGHWLGCQRQSAFARVRKGVRDATRDEYVVCVAD